jgi:hypothetical protein
MAGTGKSKAEMDSEELRRLEDEAIRNGPLNILNEAVKENSQVGAQNWQRFCESFVTF